MKILFIPGFANPFDIYSGANIRSFYIAKCLCKMGTVDMASFSNFHNPGESIFSEIKFKNIYHLRLGPFPYWNEPPLLKSSFLSYKIYRIFDIIFNKNPFYPINYEAAAKIKRIIEKNDYDLIFVIRIEVAAILDIINEKKLCIDVDDHPLDAVNCRHINKNFILKLISKKKIANYYYKYINNLPLLFFSNRNQVKKDNEAFLPNLFPPQNYHTRKKENNKNSFLFVGSLSYIPNYSGLDYFITKIWPKVKGNNKDFIFNIIGGGLPSKYIKKWSNIPGIKLMGFVKNIDSIYSTSSIFICPTYSGAGTNIKILEAMKRGIPIIATQHSIRGYENILEDGKNIFVVNNDKEFKEKILYLNSNLDLKIKFSQAAIKILENSPYNFEYFYKTIKETLYRFEKGIN